MLAYLSHLFSQTKGLRSGVESDERTPFLDLRSYIRRIALHNHQLLFFYPFLSIDGYALLPAVKSRPLSKFRNLHRHPAVLPHGFKRSRLASFETRGTAKPLSILKTILNVVLCSARLNRNIRQTNQYPLLGPFHTEPDSRIFAVDIKETYR